ncbi:MAG: universal stress protein [Pseudomonadota bacterium]
MSVTVMLGGDVAAVGPAIETAVHLTKRFGSTLTGLCAMPDPATASIYISGAETVVLGGAAIASMAEAQETQTERFKEAFKATTDASGSWLHANFDRRVGSVALHGAVRASLADAFVLPKEATESNHGLNPVFEHVLMEANLPLVLAPKTAKESDTCMIAWDGSPIAARAVKMHLPLIATYKHAIIAEHPGKVRHQWSPECEDTKARLTEILQEQRLDVTSITLEGAVSKGLLDACAVHEVSMLVMGAYGHARIGQMLFGGTTSKMLHSDASPALALCH